MRFKVSASKAFSQFSFRSRSSKYHGTIEPGAFSYWSVILSDSQKLKDFKTKPLVTIAYKWLKELIGVSFCGWDKVLRQEKLTFVVQGIMVGETKATEAWSIRLNYVYNQEISMD